MANAILHIPIKAVMLRHPDGSYSIDQEHSEYADISADDFASFLLHQFGHDAIFKEEGAEA